ncbi:hypothetical protein A0J59_04250 [Cellulosimicrobium sp. I38E]|nr:hypothetical protein A0J59_04250 [Cellulosimicrobium sp. I38E]
MVLAGRTSPYPSPIPHEFCRDVVAVACQGGSVAQISKDFGITESCVRDWLKAADVDDGVQPGVTKQESAELRELKRRNRQLEQEVEILRRAAAYFANEISPKWHTRWSVTWPRTKPPSR